MRYSFILLLAITLRAEVQPVSPPPAGSVTIPVAPAPSGSNTFPIFDSNFFNSKPEANVGNSDRYNAPDAKITVDKQDQFREECKDEINKGMKSFRKCYSAKENDEVRKMRTGRDDIERKQQMPLSNVPSVIEDYQRPPSSEE